MPASVVIETKRATLRDGMKDPWLMEPYFHYTGYGNALGEKTSRKRKRSETPPATSPAQRHWDDFYADNLDPKMVEMHMKIQALVDSFCASLCQTRQLLS